MQEFQMIALFHIDKSKLHASNKTIFSSGPDIKGKRVN